MGLEPTTATLATWRSTTELHPHKGNENNIMEQVNQQVVREKKFAIFS